MSCGRKWVARHSNSGSGSTMVLRRKRTVGQVVTQDGYGGGLNRDERTIRDRGVGRGSGE